MSCVLCDGELKVLGQLGSKIWCRCINCGIDQSPDIERCPVCQDIECNCSDVADFEGLF